MTFRCASDQSGNLSSQATPSDHSICEIALPIYDGEQPLAVLDVIAKEGRGFDPQDVTLLKDLADLATNAIVNTLKQWKVAQEKLNLITF
jgi:putative methionine-R-sulfoxide reductase with GAF domain